MTTDKNTSEGIDVDLKKRFYSNFGTLGNEVGSHIQRTEIWDFFKAEIESLLKSEREKVIKSIENRIHTIVEISDKDDGRKKRGTLWEVWTKDLFNLLDESTDE